MQAFVQELQRTIRGAIEEMDGRAVFKEDAWMRPGGGGGLSAVLSEGAVFEKAGVNTSVVYGELSEQVLADLLGNIVGGCALFFCYGYFSGVPSEKSACSVGPRQFPVFRIGR